MVTSPARCVLSRLEPSEPTGLLLDVGPSLTSLGKACKPYCGTYVTATATFAVQGLTLMWAPLKAPEHVCRCAWARMGTLCASASPGTSECTFVLCAQALQCLLPLVPCIAVCCLHALCLCAVGGILQVHVLVYLLLCKVR